MRTQLCVFIPYKNALKEKQTILHFEGFIPLSSEQAYFKKLFQEQHSLHGFTLQKLPQQVAVLLQEGYLAMNRRTYDYRIVDAREILELPIDCQETLNTYYLSKERSVYIAAIQQLITQENLAEMNSNTYLWINK